MGLFSLAGALIKGAVKIATGFLTGFVAGGFVQKIKDKFKEIAINMMNVVANKLQDKIQEKILGTGHAYELENGQWMERTKSYTVDSEIGEWNEIVVSKKRALEEIPQRYRSHLEEINDTKEIKEEMEMIYGQ